MVVLSCKSFNPLNRVQEDGHGARGAFAREKNVMHLLSEHDFKDLKDGQDGVTSCPSFNL